jgi:hypothetical protein
MTLGAKPFQESVKSRQKMTGSLSSASSRGGRANMSGYQSLIAPIMILCCSALSIATLVMIGAWWARTNINRRTMREEFASVAFLAVTLAGVVLLGSGLLALIVVG